MNEIALPLSGVRVLDLSTVVAGPFGSEILGELGADVIRVEPPPAEEQWPSRAKGAPVSDQEGFTYALQRNKTSLCLDLKDKGGRAAFEALVKVSDVVYDNFRAGVLERLGIDYASLKRINPKIICCSITGFGSSGPWAQVGAYNVAVQALGGSMSITGTGEANSLPCRWGVPVGDIAGSMYAVIGVLAALEERDRTGMGQSLEVSLLDCQLALNTYRVPQAFGAGMDFETPSPRRGGAGAVPYGPFQCGDSAWLVIAVASNFWKAFANVIGEPEWLGDPRFATLRDRQANQGALDALIERKMRTRSAAEWETALIAAGVPCGRVNTIGEAIDQPQAAARGMHVSFTDHGGREVGVAGSPIKFRGEGERPQQPPRHRGANTVESLRKAGLTPETIGLLLVKKVAAGDAS
jgi:crotonobetainyl-CoA:carnitine CoA-transferase CaiB-like acyl-CoA transferase